MLKRCIPRRTGGPIAVAIYRRGWMEDLIRREETAGAVEVVEGR